MNQVLNCEQWVHAVETQFGIYQSDSTLMVYWAFRVYENPLFFICSSSFFVFPRCVGEAALLALSPAVPCSLPLSLVLKTTVECISLFSILS